MSNVSAENQVILRNIDAIPAGKVLLLDAMQDHATSEFEALRSDIEWHAFTPFADTADFLSGKMPVYCNAWLQPTDVNNFDAVVIYFPKTKLRFDYYLSMVSKLLKAGAPIFVVGEKKGGVKSTSKSLKAFCPAVNKLDSARHCMLFAGAFNGDICEKFMADWFQQVDFNINVGGKTIPLTLASLPGVFAATQLDTGTAMLLEQTTGLSGTGLDFGCGCGVVSASVALAFNVEMTALDVDALAIESTKKTFALNELTAKTIHSNGLDRLLKDSTKFDFIVTNPPFHTGIRTDYSIVTLFVKQASKILKRNYQLWLVANSFLPYPELFKQYLKPASEVENDKRFSVYHINKN